MLCNSSSRAQQHGTSSLPISYCVKSVKTNHDSTFALCAHHDDDATPASLKLDTLFGLLAAARLLLISIDTHQVAHAFGSHYGRPCAAVARHNVPAHRCAHSAAAGSNRMRIAFAGRSHHARGQYPAR